MTIVPDEEKVYRCTITLIRGKFRGIRGAMYKLAYNLKAKRRRDVREAIWYRQDDMLMDLFFMKDETTTDFINGVCKIVKIPDVVRKIASYKPQISFEVESYTVRLSMLTPISDMELDEIHAISPEGSIDYDRAIQDLSSFSTSTRRTGSSRSSKRCSAIDKDGQLFKWQTLENPDLIGQPYRCHLVGREFRPEEDVNNYIAGSWTFHQLLDGMNLDVQIPLMEVNFAGEPGLWEEDEGVFRHKVDLRLTFFESDHNEEFKNNFRGRLKEGSSVLEDGSISTFVHVIDVDEFRMNLDIKRAKTLREWRRFRKYLQNNA